MILVFLFVVWSIGLFITFIHETAHFVFSGGKLNYMQIGIADRFGRQ